MNEPAEAQSEEAGSSPESWRARIAPLKPWQLIVAPLVVVVLGGVAVAALTAEQTVVIRDGAPSRPELDRPPKNVIEQVEQRDFWASPPLMFPSARTAFEEYHVYPVVELEFGGQPAVVTPGELANRAVDYEGRDVILVGRAAEEVAVGPPLSYPGLGDARVRDEIRLVGRDGTTAYIGAESGTGAADLRGEVVYAPGRTAAVGTTRGPDGETQRGAYFLASRAGDVEQPIDTADLPQSVASAIRAARRQRLNR